MLILLSRRPFLVLVFRVNYLKETSHKILTNSIFWQSTEKPKEEFDYLWLLTLILLILVIGLLIGFLLYYKWVSQFVSHPGLLLTRVEYVRHCVDKLRGRLKSMHAHGTTELLNPHECSCCLSKREKLSRRSHLS